MGQYVLKVDPQITDPETISSLQDVIDRFHSLPGSQLYLNMPTRSGGDFVVTTRPEAFIGDNIKTVRDYQFLGSTFRGFTQGTSNNLPKVTYLNLDSDKDPLRVLIHEVGHIKWPGYAANNPTGQHSPEFYKLLGDSLTQFGLKPDAKDLQGVDISKVPSPAGNGNPLLFNVAPPRSIVPNSPGNPDFGPYSQTNSGDQSSSHYYGTNMDPNYGAGAGAF